jgi:hypothetical protein
MGFHLRGLVLLGACAVGTVVGLARWAATPDRVPASLQQASGVIDSAVRKGRRSRSSTVVLTIRDHPQRFRYPSYYPSARTARDEVRRGRHADVLYAPNAFGTGVDVWGLTVVGWVYVTPEQILAARQAQAKWFLVHAGLFLGAGVLILAFASPLDMRSLRRRFGPSARRGDRKKRRKHRRPARARR